MGVRRPGAARSAVADQPGVRVAELDLADLGSVRSFSPHPGKILTGLVGVASWACDPAEAARLWTLSAELTGVDAFTAAGTGAPR